MNETAAFSVEMDGHVAWIDEGISFGNGGLTEGQIINNNNPPDYDGTRLGVRRYRVRYRSTGDN